MEDGFIGLIVGLIVLKVIILTIYCCIRAQRRPAIVVVDASRVRQRNPRNDGVAIVEQAAPMGTSPPPNPPAKQAPRLPSYEQSTHGPNPYRQDPIARDRPRHYPQNPNVGGPSFQDGNYRRPYPQDPKF